MIRTAILILLFLAPIASANMLLFGNGYGNGLRLRRRFRFCPSDYPRGLHLNCPGGRNALPTFFFVAGSLVALVVRPPFDFTLRLGRKYRGVAMPSSAHGTSFTVICGTLRRRSRVVFEVKCDDDTPPAPKEGSIKLFAWAVPEARKWVELRDGMRVCPPTLLRSSKLAVLCVTKEEPEEVQFLVNGAMVRRESRAPYFIAGYRPWNSTPWRRYPWNIEFSLGCRLGGPGAYTYTVRRIRFGCEGFGYDIPVGDNPVEDSQKEKAGCVDRSAPDTRLTKGWTNTADGIEFNAGELSIETAAEGVLPLVYLFKPLQTGRHAILVELTTRGALDYNDIWLHLSAGGFMLTRRAQTLLATGWIKGFHTQFRRSAALVSGNLNLAHSISSAQELQAGGQYKLEISGRSNLVIVHRIVMFPCDDVGCELELWKSRQEICLPGST